jgi:hypothetical protein
MKLIKEYENIINKIAERFLKDLYKEDYIDVNTDSYWVADEVGGVFYFHGYFICMNVIIDYFKYNYTPDEFFDYYDYNLSNPINMKNYKKLNKNS